jgi:hypothetical protein
VFFTDGISLIGTNLSNLLNLKPLKLFLSEHDLRISGLPGFFLRPLITLIEGFRGFPLPRNRDDLLPPWGD